MHCTSVKTICPTFDPPPPRVTRLRRRPTRPRHSPTRRSPTHPRRSSPTHLRHSRIPRHRSNLCTRSNPRSTRYAQPLLFTVLAQSRTLTLLDPRPRFHIISSPTQGGLTAGDRATAERRMRQREADRKALGLMCGGFLCCLCIGVDRAAVRFGGSLPICATAQAKLCFKIGATTTSPHLVPLPPLSRTWVSPLLTAFYAWISAVVAKNEWTAKRRRDLLPAHFCLLRVSYVGVRLPRDADF